MLNESVIKVLKNGMWDLATCANGEPNVVPVAFKDVTEDGKLIVGDVFLETTLKNIKANNGKIAIELSRCATACQGCGIAAFLFNKKAVTRFSQ